MRYEATGSLTVVISPLVALMADQVTSMRRQGITSVPGLPPSSSSMRAAATYPGGTGRCVRRSLPGRWQPSPEHGWVGSHITGFKRSLQEAYWQRIMESYGMREEEFLHMLEVSDAEGPGSISWDPNFDYPEYATVDIYIQTGSYVYEPLGGFHYDYGTKVFFGGVNNDDVLHTKMAAKTSLPLDGKVERIMDIGCAIGQFSCALKERFPEAEVWGTDIGAPMVRYAHHRARKKNLEVHFAQMACEDLDFPDIPRSRQSPKFVVGYEAEIV